MRSKVIAVLVLIVIILISLTAQTHAYDKEILIHHRAPAGSKCPQHYHAALRAGWSNAHWSKLDYIMWRESRCKPTVHNTKGRDNSYGLLQLNMKAHKSWVKPIVQGNYTALFNAEVNLRVGKALYDRAKKMFGCGFQPWKTTKQKHWCN